MLKSTKRLVGIISLFVILSSSIFAQKEKQSTKITIDEARRVFVGKSVKTFGEANSDGKLSGWYYADKKDGKYTRRPYSVWNGSKRESTNLPIRYRWQKAVIVAIELDEKSIPKTNALGETIDEEKTVSDFVYVFVKFADGTIASNLNRIGILFGEKEIGGMELRFSSWKTLLLTTDLIKREKFINSKIKSIIGRQVFATASSKLYSINSTLVELIDEKTQVKDFQYLEPLTITTAKYNKDADIIILKLEDKTGRQYLTFSNYVPQKKIQDFFETIVNNMVFPELFPQIPKYSEREIAAIKSRTVFIGMPIVIIFYALGSPESWDWGESSSQTEREVMTFFDGKLKIFIDKKTRQIVDIQDKR
jgi:hypothetical protein